jgi:hypothetical protein
LNFSQACAKRGVAYIGLTPPDITDAFISLISKGLNQSHIKFLGFRQQIFLRNLQLDWEVIKIISKNDGMNNIRHVFEQIPGVYFCKTEKRSSSADSQSSKRRKLNNDK